MVAPVRRRRRGEIAELVVDYPEVNPDIPLSAENPDLKKNLGTIQFYDQAGQPAYHQYTYLGHPLFYYRNDRNAGDVNGHNITDGNWTAVLLGAIKIN